MSYNTEAALLRVSHNEPERFIEEAGRLCYGTDNLLGTQKNWVQTRIKQGHESILEHVSATFRIKCSRVVSHELVRHRIASFSQKSQRYVKEDSFSFITPPELEVNEDYIEVIQACQIVYNSLIEKGIKPELSRYVLPNACMTEIIMTMNLRELRHFIKLRTSKAALPEMREVANKIKELCMGFAPKVFEDL